MMLKGKILIIVWLIIVFYICVPISCTHISLEESGRHYFTIDSIEGKMVLPILLDNSIEANLCFDTGTLCGSLDLDSAFCAEHPSILSGLSPVDSGYGGSAWASLKTYIYMYDNDQTIKIGNAGLLYNHMLVYNWKYHAGSNLDGLLNIPQNDTIHVWELNFEHSYLKIHSAQDFVMPENCFVTPFIRDKYKKEFNVQLPIKVETSSGDVLNLNHTYLIDTGMRWDVALMSNAEELHFFNKQKNAVWTGYLDTYYRSYDVKGSLPGFLNMDSLRIYTFDMPNDIHGSYLLGLNFLKRFNVFFDMKNRWLGLQAISNYRRIVNPLRRRFHIGFTQTSQGKMIVSKVADYEGNYYKTAGFVEGDEIINFNGVPYNKITPETFKSFFERDILHYDILRGGHPMKITVHVDKDEAQGD